MTLTISLAITGASGLAYGLRLTDCLLEAGYPIDLMVSEAAYKVAEHEAAMSLSSWLSEKKAESSGRLRLFGDKEWTGTPASGSSCAKIMIVCPCSMGTLAAIAHGLSDNLIERAADVVLKERGRLILVTRETPLSAIHLENMLKVTQAGGIILPASPGFYHRPEKVSDLIDFIVARILDLAGIPQASTALLPRWGSHGAERTASGME